MVAGTTSWLRTISSTDLAVLYKFIQFIIVRTPYCMLIGYGMPCVTIVVSKATTGLFEDNASVTSGCTSIYGNLVPVWYFD